MKEELRQIHEQIFMQKKAQIDKQDEIKEEIRQIAKKAQFHVNFDQEKRDPDKIRNVAKCVICLDNEVTIALQPCGHICACYGCSEKLQKECPICRTTFKTTLRIYFP